MSSTNRRTWGCFVCCGMSLLKITKKKDWFWDWSLWNPASARHRIWFHSISNNCLCSVGQKGLNPVSSLLSDVCLIKFVDETVIRYFVERLVEVITFVSYFFLSWTALRTSDTNSISWDSQGSLEQSPCCLSNNRRFVFRCPWYGWTECVVSVSNGCRSETQGDGLGHCIFHLSWSHGVTCASFKTFGIFASLMKHSFPLN